MRTFQRLAVAAGVGLTAVSAYGAPKVDITGLDAATQWIWIEAEDATSLTTWTTRTYGSSRPNESPNVSQETVPDHTASDLMPIHVYGANVNPPYGASATWSDFHLPSAFTNATMYAYEGSDRNRSFTVTVDGTDVGTLTLQETTGDAWVASQWTAGASLGDIAAGTQTLKVATTGFTASTLDGLYIVEGTATPANGSIPAGPNDQFGIHWRGAPAGVSSPELPAGVAPVISVADAVQTFITLDGNPYVSGTPITAAGDHVLMIESFGNVFADLGNDGKVYNDRILVGANFTIVPEPGSMGLLLGVAGMMLTRRRRAA